jgi:predicted Na+-dependent transporter
MAKDIQAVVHIDMSDWVERRMKLIAKVIAVPYFFGLVPQPTIAKWIDRLARWAVNRSNLRLGEVVTVDG